MSFELYLARYSAGSNASFSRERFERIFGPRIVKRESEFRCVTLKYPDGHGCDVYIRGDQEIGGFTVSRPGGDGLFDDLVQLMKDVGAAAYWPGHGPCLAVADPSVIADLPEDMVESIGPAVTVVSGAELIEAIRRT